MAYSCGEADEAGFWVGLGGRGRERMIRPSEQETERGSDGKGLKKDG